MKHSLEHFYYGQFVRSGKPEGDLRLLAYSSGVKPDQAAAIVQDALLPPLKGEPAWAIVRSKQAPFVMVRSQLGAAGQSMLHYVLLPTEVLRRLGGNLDALLPLVQMPMPEYDRLGDTLSWLDLDNVEPPSPEAQIDHLLDLMTFTHNSTAKIEKLLAALVQGVPLVIESAPRELVTRAGFVKGLMALLPPPARFGVTFATHTVASTRLDAQIRFFSGEDPLAESLVYDWANGQISGKTVEDEYSQYIISQLRLDAELVIRHTSDLTAVAAWRIKRGDTLADALGYASYRLSVDVALRNSQPVGAEDVAQVLAEDPTLDEDERLMYARHLLRLATVMGSIPLADPIAIQLRHNPALETETLRELESALDKGKADLVYTTLARWLANPLGPRGTQWVRLAHRAAETHIATLVRQQDVRGAHDFVAAIQDADPALEMQDLVPRLLEMTLPLSTRDSELAETLFLLAVNYLNQDVLRNLLESSRFVAQLPPRTKRLAPYITGRDEGFAPAGLLADVAAAFGENWQPLVLMRLTEVALTAGRLDLLDTSALAGLVGFTRTPWAAQYERSLLWAVGKLSTDDSLTALGEPGTTYLLQILLSAGTYGDLAHEMMHQSRLLYPGDRQLDYVRMVYRLFADTPLAADAATTALEDLTRVGIKGLPLVMAYSGMLEGQGWPAALRPVVDKLLDYIFQDRTMVRYLLPRTLLSLLRFYARDENVAACARVAALIPDVAVEQGKGGIRMMLRAYKMLDWHDQLRIAALELLRRYVRQVELPLGRQAVGVFGRELGPQVHDALEVTYTFKRMMGGSDLLDYAHFIHVTAVFLYDTALAYAEKTHIPSLGALTNAVQTATGALSRQERKDLARDVLALGRSIALLGNQHRTHLPRDLENRTERLVTGKDAPVSAIEVLWVMGGYFAKGKRYTVRLQGMTRYPLAQRSATTLRDETARIHQLLRAMLQAFKPEKPVNLSADMIRNELDSLWSEVPLADQREIVRDLANDLQQVAALVLFIAENGDSRALEQTSLGRKLDSGKQQPKSTLEFYRYLHGYYDS